MRTTLDIDDDLLKRLREAAQRARAPLKKVVNMAIRRGIQAERKPSAAQRYRCPALSMGRPLFESVNLDKALALSSTLEDTEVARELELRK